MSLGGESTDLLAQKKGFAPFFVTPQFLDIFFPILLTPWTLLRVHGPNRNRSAAHRERQSSLKATDLKVDGVALWSASARKPTKNTVKNIGDIF